jgi:hypothetical protein
MAREFSVRLAPPLAAFLREQPDSPTKTLLALSRALWERREDVRLPDPGGGPERFKFRLEARLVKFLRRATHSRDTAPSIRRLLAWGMSNLYALPVSRPSSLPSGSVAMVARRVALPVVGGDESLRRGSLARGEGQTAALALPRELETRTLAGEVLTRRVRKVGPGRSLEPVRVVLREIGVVVEGAPGIRWPTCIRAKAPCYLEPSKEGVD